MRSLLAALLLTSGVSLADEKRPVVPVEAGDETVSLAKEDLASIKSATRGLGDSQASLPSLQAPDLSVPVASSFATRAKTETLRAKPSGNWLVDGVMNSKKGQEGAQGRSKDLPSATPPAGDLGIASQSTAGEDPVATAKETEAAVSEAEPVKASSREVVVVNPLDAFMSSWMSGRDMEALKPVLPAHGTSEAPGGESASLEVMATQIGPSKPAELAPVQSPSGPVATQENPFLELLNSPLPPAASEPELKASLPLPVQPPQNNEVTSGPKDVVPDYAKELQEDPAFKQMRRF